jgi:hypothetical protein
MEKNGNIYYRNDGKFIIYQTIGISLVHESKHQINQRYLEKSYGYVDKDKNNFSVASGFCMET